MTDQTTEPEANYWPNTFQTPNIYVDEVLPLLTGNEAKVLFAATREIMGWKKKRPARRARISLSRFQVLTGLNRTTVIKCLERLTRANLMSEIGEWNGDGQMYELNLGQHGAYDLNDLRYTNRRSGNPNPEAAREARSKIHQPASDTPATSGGQGGLSNRPPETDPTLSGYTGTGLSDRPEAVYPIDTTKLKNKKDELILNDSLNICLPCGLTPITAWEKAIELVAITDQRATYLNLLKDRTRLVCYQEGEFHVEVTSHQGDFDWLARMNPGGPFQLSTITKNPHARVVWSLASNAKRFTEVPNGAAR